MHRSHTSRKLFELLVILAIVLVARALSLADALGAIDGTLVGAGGRPLAGDVTITCGKVTRTARLDDRGHFTVTGLPAGTCTVTDARGHAVQVTVAGGATASIRIEAPVQPVTTRPAIPTRPPPPAQHEPARRADMKAPAAAGKAEAPIAVLSPGPASPTKHVMAKPSAMGRIGNAPAAAPLDQDPEMNTEAYARTDDNPFFRTKTAPLSTFSVDVDTASYANLRRFLRDGRLPPKDAVRIEEMINYFRYDYPAPDKADPFSITTEIGPSPWAPRHQLVRIGLKAPEIDDRQVPPRNLVFLLDVSGSMMPANKLPLLKHAMGLLVETLRPEDRVSIVTYAGATGVALPPTSGRDKDTIRMAIARLESGGSTNGAAGIQLAYDQATRAFLKKGINRVILCTDGDFNVGLTSEGELTRLIERERDRGVFLTVLGFGMGNLKDATMEKLADRGNGNYAYIDSIAEARKVLVKEAGATLVTVAKDVKLQVEFNPALVAGYRLIGYENRVLRNEDFNDDRKDAGDIGAGHNVTALYEIVPVGVEVPGGKVDDLKYQQPGGASAAAGTGELLTVKIRYKAPDASTSKLLSRPVRGAAPELAKTSTDFRWAAAMSAFGMMLRDSPYRGNLSWAQIQALAQGAVGSDVEGYRKQALRMIEVASHATR
jgi:Ca-activated chloride channel family protein